MQYRVNDSPGVGKGSVSNLEDLDIWSIRKRIMGGHDLSAGEVLPASLFARC